jgi:hypothetical protein
MEYVMATRPQWRTLLSLTFLTFAAVSNVARADSIPIVTGEQWVHSSDEAKKAYLVGVANVLEIERAYDAGNKSADQDLAPRFAKVCKVKPSTACGRDSTTGTPGIRLACSIR